MRKKSYQIINFTKLTNITDIKIIQKHKIIFLLTTRHTSLILFPLHFLTGYSLIASSVDNNFVIFSIKRRKESLDF